MARKQYGKNVAKMFLGVVLLVVAAVGLAYWSLVREMGRAENDYSQGATEAALRRYENVEKRLRAVGILRFFPARDRQNLFLNQARLLYDLGRDAEVAEDAETALERYDEAAERLERENEIASSNSDGRFFLWRGNIAFRKAWSSYKESERKDMRILLDAWRAAEENLRDSMRANPNDWDAKFNFEFINYIRSMMSQDEGEKVQILMENVREKPKPADLPPEAQS